MDKKILVVDDAKFARNLVARTLQDGGYTNIVQAGTAADAVEVFEKEQPELVLLDITLPDCNDLSLLKKLLEIKPEAKIVMNSAIGQNLIIADALEIGAADFITKPFDEQHLIEVVSNILSEV